MINPNGAYYDHILIDLNNLFWRSMYTCFKKSVDLEQDNVYAGTIQEVLKRVRDIHECFGKAQTKVYFLCDNPFSKINERKEILPSYKHARKNRVLPSGFYKSLDTLIEILKSYSNDFYVVQESNLEADDLVPIVLKAIQNDYHKYLLVSNDLDWARGIREAVSWFNFYSLYTIESFRSEYGFSPKGKTIQMYKAIHGDDSDNIQNAVPHLPKKLLTFLVNKYSTIKDMLVGIHNDGLSPKWIKRICDAETQLKINHQLVDYMTIEGITFEAISIQCKEKIKLLQWHFKLLDIPFEARMITDKKDVGADFFDFKKPRRAR